MTTGWVWESYIIIIFFWRVTLWICGFRSLSLVDLLFTRAQEIYYYQISIGNMRSAVGPASLLQFLVFSLLSRVGWISARISLFYNDYYFNENVGRKVIWSFYLTSCLSTFQILVLPKINSAEICRQGENKPNNKLLHCLTL